MGKTAGLIMQFLAGRLQRNDLKVFPLLNGVYKQNRIKSNLALRATEKLNLELEPEIELANLGIHRVSHLYNLPVGHRTIHLGTSASVEVVKPLFPEAKVSKNGGQLSVERTEQNFGLNFRIFPGLDSRVLSSVIGSIYASTQSTLTKNLSLGMHLLLSEHSTLTKWEHVTYRPLLIPTLEFLLHYAEHPPWLDLLRSLRPAYGTKLQDRLSNARSSKKTSQVIVSAVELINLNVPVLLNRQSISSLEENRSDVQARLRTRKIHQLAIVRELSTLQRGFLEKGIDAIHYKGPIWSQQLHQSPLERVFHDLDILLDPKDIYSAREILHAAGYVDKYPLGSISDWKAIRIDGELSFFKNREDAQNFRHFEIHTSIAPYAYRFGLDYTVLTRHCLTVELNGQNYHSLDCNASLIVACLSFSKDGWISVKQLYDIHGWISQYQIDWDLVFSLARKKKFLNYILIGVACSQRIFQTHVSGQIERLFRKHNIYPLAEHILHNLDRGLTATQSEVFAARGSHSVRRKMRVGHFISQMAPNHADQEFWKFIPDSKAFLPMYTCLKPIRALLQGQNNDDDFRPWV